MMNTLAEPQPAAETPEEFRISARRPVPPLNDERLVSRAQAGDQRAFNELAERHSSMLRRVQFRILKDCDAAWDAMQETLVSAWRNIGRFQGRSKFSTWLTRIGINEAYRGVRKGRPEALELDDAVGQRVPDWSGRPEEIFESREFLAVITDRLDRLSSEYRTAVMLGDVEGFSAKEAADLLGIGERAFKSRLHRGRMALRSELDEYFEGGYVR